METPYTPTVSTLLREETLNLLRDLERCRRVLIDCVEVIAHGKSPSEDLAWDLRAVLGEDYPRKEKECSPSL